MEKVSDAHKGEKESQSLKNASKTEEKEIQRVHCVGVQKQCGIKENLTSSIQA